jgi:hypothetical protein
MSKVKKNAPLVGPYIGDILCEIMANRQPQILEDTLKAGIPITYMDQDDNIVKEFPDGTVEILRT